MQSSFQVAEKRKQKRNRISLSCISCKKRKVKCDRGNPCQACVKYHGVCEYPISVWTTASQNEPGSSYQIHGFDATKRRISEIESSLGHPSTGHSPFSTASNDSVLLPPIKKLHFNWNEYKYNPDTNPTYIGINPYANNTETINFYDGYTPLFLQDKARTHNYGPFSWMTIMNKDPGLRRLWKFVQNESLKKIEQHLTSTHRHKQIPHDEIVAEVAKQDANAAACFEISESEVAFRDKAVDRDGYNDLRLYGNVTRKTSNLRDSTASTSRSSNTPAPSQKQIQRMAMNKHAIALGLTLYEGKMDQELQLIEKITKILPKQKVIWKLIHKFFNSVYPYMPFLDEGYFVTEMTRILGPEESNDRQLESLKVEKRLDFAYIGILLIVLRITYLSLFSNRNGVNQRNLATTDPSFQAQEIKYLLSNPIDIDVIAMAQLCLDQFDIFHKSNIVILQCAFFMRLYYMFAPEEGDGADGGDSQIFSGTIIQMAYSMGLNREPDNFPDVSNDERSNNMARKIWLFLIIGDLIQGYQYGNPMSIDQKYYDTKLPYYKPGNENVKDIELEKHVISTFAYFEKYYSKLVALLDVGIDVRKHVTMKELTELITDFEISLNDHYGLLKFFLVPFKQDNYTYPFIKAMKCKNYINMKMFLNTILFHLYLHYEKSDTTFAFFYLKKILASLCTEFIPCMFQLIADNYLNFGPVADLFLNPTLESMIHKATVIISAVLVRVNSSIYKLRYVETDKHDDGLWNSPSYRLHYAKLVKFSKVLTRIMKFCIAAISRLSQRYYYAWRLTKAHGYIGTIIIGTEFYKNTKSDPILLIDLTNDQLSELLKISELTLKKYTKHVDIFNEDIDVINECAQSCSPPPEILGEEPDCSHNNAPPVKAQPTPDPHKQHLYNDSFASSSASLNDEDFGCLQNDEIDKLWYQMAAMKQTGPISTPSSNFGSSGSENGNYSNGNANNINQNPVTANVNMSYPVFGSPAGFNNIMGMGMGDGEVDLFNALSVDQLLGLTKDGKW
ncbi:uncharacterized protein SPAPADRAFT_152446 [Spathaspora passalidarum NRRL Y-27907]|uniref:Zn(2)-C6 fungal-type domain-containing protein n=1 Tax=Spathaspora passalidarum (strain NRRL Y-27907 / 11-Y1) TaxID=619300 RepID=G3AP35_SPAPN|nr:uncharacterized protein SPAPADRAFT_152446 [Spathaspora passalidarum NRRL Y-27907]EGW32066.1 hypothetical protein SPAPADRAFT_152446 [Spathaspora passalidarum NRRL Y-27907]